MNCLTLPVETTNFPWIQLQFSPAGEQCTICSDNWSKQHRAIDWNNKFQFRAERRRNLIHWSVRQCYCLYQDTTILQVSINQNFVSGSLWLPATAKPCARPPHAGPEGDDPQGPLRAVQVRQAQADGEQWGTQGNRSDAAAAQTGRKFVIIVWVKNIHPRLRTFNSNSSQPNFVCFLKSWEFFHDPQIWMVSRK